jgi:hypothetical protein
VSPIPVACLQITKPYSELSKATLANLILVFVVSSVVPLDPKMKLLAVMVAAVSKTIDPFVAALPIPKTIFPLTPVLDPTTVIALPVLAPASPAPIITSPLTPEASVVPVLIVIAPTLPDTTSPVNISSCPLPDPVESPVASLSSPELTPVASPVNI